MRNSSPYVRLDDWSPVVTDNNTAFLRGKVRNHPDQVDGSHFETRVITSTNERLRVVKTRDGLLFKLGPADPDFRAAARKGRTPLERLAHGSDF